MKPRRSLQAVLVAALLLPALASAQSPNTAAVLIVVIDQSGAVVRDANVTVVNSATGATRRALSGAGGSATFSGLSLTCTYTVSGAKAGFTAEDVRDLTLRAGETGTVKVR